MAKRINKHLVSLAYLQVLWDREKKILLDLYLPFLAEILVRKEIGVISEDKIPEISEQIEQEFTFKIPFHPLVSLLNRAKKKGILKRKEHKFYVNFDKLEKIRPDLQESEENIQMLFAILQDYIKKHFPDRKLSKQDIANALIDYLNQFDYQIITDPSTVKSLRVTKKEKENLFILASIIKRLYEEDKPAWRLFQNIVIGHFLSKIILSDQHSIPTKYKNLKVYLDTKIIFRLIGVEGEVLKKIYETFISNVKKQGIKLFIFRHTYNEILDILDGCYEWIDRPNYDPSKASIALRYFKENGYHQSDIELLRNNLPNILQNMGIQVVNPPSASSTYQIDEKKLKVTIMDVYSENPRFKLVEKEYTIERDVKSISSIYQLRRGNKPINIKQTKHLFVTSNSGLAYAVLKFHKKEASTLGFNIPPCVTDTFLGTIIWINDPQKVEDNITLSSLSLSIAITQPTKDFLEKWNREIKKLLDKGDINDDQYILLRDSFAARELLNEKTLGDPDQISPKTAIEILEEIEREGLRKYEEERKRHEDTKYQAEKYKKEKEKLEETISNRAEKIANWIAKGSFAFSVLLLFLTMVLTIIPENKTIKVIDGIIGGILTLILTIIGLLGITVKSVKSWLKQKIENFLKGI